MNNDEWIDEYGVMYSADKKRLIKGRYDLIEYQVIKGCEIISEKAFSYFPCDSIFSENGIPDGIIDFEGRHFKLCRQLQSIIIPESVTVIEKCAFEGCSKLKEVHLPKGLKAIGYCAFEDTDLEKFYIPDNVSEFKYPFSGCKKLQEIVCDNPYFQSINGVLFSKDLKTLLVYPPAKEDTEYNIPNSVITIGYSAFSSCHNLKKIHIPNSVKIIESEAFSGCDFQNIVIPNSVTTIDEFSFMACINLENITIEKNITSIGRYAFYDCNKLVEIHCKNQIPPNIGDSCFEGVFNCKLYVPLGSKEAYQKAWWDFENIIEE